MKQFINIALFTVLGIMISACNNDNSDYPKIVKENVKITFPAYYFDIEKVSDSEYFEVGKAKIINYKAELDEFFSIININPPKEFSQIIFSGTSLILVIHTTKFKKIEIEHDLSFELAREHGIPYYHYKITETGGKDKVSNESSTQYTYFTGVAIGSIFSTTPIEVLFTTVD